MNGWIKVHKKIVDWEWWTEPLTAHLFLHLVCSASWEDTNWKGVEIKRGQVIVGLKKLSVQTGIPERSLRTSFERLKSTGAVTIKTTHRFSIVTVCNYDNYQADERPSDTVIDTQTTRRTTHKRHATDTLPTTSEELKNIRIKEDKKNIYIPIEVTLDDLPISLKTEQSLAAIREWVDFKATTLKTPYKSIVSVRKLLKSYSSLGSARFIQVVEYAMSKEWLGLHPELTPTTFEPSAPKAVTTKQGYQDRVDDVQAHNRAFMAKLRAEAAQ